MNILNVVLDNHIGGIQNRIIKVGKKLKEQDIEFTLLTPIGRGDFSNLAKKEGFSCYETFIESPKHFRSFEEVWKNILWFIYFPIAVFDIYRIIKKEKIDIVHLNGVLSLQAALAAKITRKPIVWHLISSLYPNSLIFLLRPIFKSFSSKMVFVSYNSVCYYLGSEYDENTFKIIQEPVDTVYFNQKSVEDNIRSDLKRKLDIPDEYQVIGFIGNINPIKRIEYIIEIANQIRIKGKKVKFLIIGEELKIHKNYLKYLKKLISNLNLKNEVIFTGKMSTKDIRDLLSIMDVYLMTSSAEGTPLVILEAMSMKKPIISTNVGGISEQVVNGSTGYLFNPSKKEEIIEFLTDLLDNPQKRQIFGENGRKRVKKFYSLEKCVNKHKLLYENLINK